ncbi:MAG: ligA [bacterium]|nr:MAG: ligA [bacterium]
MPDICPECESKVVRNEGEAAYRCSGGLSCPAQRKGTILHFASRQAMDIDGLGEELVSQLVDNNIIKTPADLYKLSVASLMNLERMADISASNLVDAIENSKHANLERFIYALGIPNVGEATAKDLAKFFGSLNRLMQAYPKTLQYIPEIGTEVAISISSFFAEPHNQEMITQLRASDVLLDESKKSKAIIKTTLSDFLNWLGTTDKKIDWNGIPGMGKIKAKLIADNFSNLEELMSADESTLLHIKGINQKLAKEIVRFFSEPHNIDIIKQLRECGVQLDEDVQGISASSSLVRDKTFVFTGALSQFKRDEAKRRVEELGGKVASAVSNSTTYVVTGENPGSKADKAKALGVNIITEDEFKRLIEG